MTMKEKLSEYGGFLDVGILSHGFAPHMRDYDIVFEASRPASPAADRQDVSQIDTKPRCG